MSIVEGQDVHLVDGRVAQVLAIEEGKFVNTDGTYRHLIVMIKGRGAPVTAIVPDWMTREGALEDV